ncbi:ewing's tumor-associated antigen 1 [Pempheris klunzingeri]|uniref:ewing's tumor-associated antigen 1 n=1 Tax=Pempheris klunzingeri TaxID=3127111 RepID=UPI003980D1C3
MNQIRREFGPPSGLTGPPLQQQQAAAAAKPNRLRRSFRRTQTAAEESRQAEFKTPTRIPRSRAAGCFSGESPHNDSDLLQDIIWDATSPSPSRLGKRGKKQPPGVVNISEIVSRIAPKHGRPKVSEPTLQQWIGDSANIPCTPDVQVVKPKKKSPRPNGVDDLLKLAKQFDCNMFGQDEEEVEELQHQELLSEDIFDGDRSDASPSPPGNRRPAVRAAAAAAGMDVQVHMDNDLDLLFDGPTQHVSGTLSQVSQVKPASGVSSKEAPGKPPASSLGPFSGVSTTNPKAASANDEFEDDWESDDLLNDSLMLEMTQNPQNFTAPKCCSTQKPTSDAKYQSPVNVPVSGQSAASKAEHVRQRTTFKLDSNPGCSSNTAEKDAQRTRFSSCKGALVETGSQRSWQTSNAVKSDPPKPQFHQRSSAGSSSTKSNTTASAARSFPHRSEVLPSHAEAPAASDLLDEDLSSFFSSDPVWDDPADDDLLCELCEDLENQIQSASTKQAPPVGQTSTQRAALQPTNRTGDNGTQRPANQKPFPQRQTPTSGPCAAGSRMNAVTDSFRYTQAKNTSGPLDSRTCVQSAAPGNTRKHQFTFRTPNGPVSTATSAVVGKCSAAEIELKKQQAMERRRRRLQAAQNLRAPT